MNNKTGIDGRIADLFEESAAVIVNNSFVLFPNTCEDAEGNITIALTCTDDDSNIYEYIITSDYNVTARDSSTLRFTKGDSEIDVTFLTYQPLFH